MELWEMWFSCISFSFLREKYMALYERIKLYLLNRLSMVVILNIQVWRSYNLKGDQLWKVNHKLAKNFFFISVAKEGNFNKAPLRCFFKIYRYWYTDLLFEVKFYFVSEHLPDDSDKLAGTVPKCIVVRPAFSPLGIIISLEGCVVSDNVPSCIYKGIS